MKKLGSYLGILALALSFATIAFATRSVIMPLQGHACSWTVYASVAGGGYVTENDGFLTHLSSAVTVYHDGCGSALFEASVGQPTDVENGTDEQYTNCVVNVTYCPTLHAALRYYTQNGHHFEGAWYADSGVSSGIINLTVISRVYPVTAGVYIDNAYGTVGSYINTAAEGSTETSNYMDYYSTPISTFAAWQNF